MATHNGIIETSTGDLLRAGFVNFTAGAGETLRTDVPIPAKVRDNEDFDKFHRWNGSTWEEVSNTPGKKKSKALNFALAGQSNTNTVDAFLQVSSSSYTVIFQFIFPGTDLLGNIEDIFALYEVEDSTETGSIRIYDVDNSNVIAEVTGLDDEEFMRKNLGTISNLPSGAAVFEIQAKTSNASKYIRLSNLTLEF